MHANSLNIDFFNFKNKKYDGKVPIFDELLRSMEDNDVFKIILPFMHKIFLFTYQQELAGVVKKKRGVDPA